MAGPLTEFGNTYSSATDNVRDHLEALRNFQADEQHFEEELQKLRVSNQEHLGYLQKKQQKELADAYTKQATKNAERIEKNHKTEIDRLKAKFKAQANLSDEEFKRQNGKSKKQAEAEIKQKEKQWKKEDAARARHAKAVAKDEIKAANEARKAKRAAENKADREVLLGSGKSIGQRWSALKNLSSKEVRDENGNLIGKAFSPTKLLDNLTTALSDMAKQLETQIDKVASYKSAVDTRLQGLNRGTGSFFGGGSAWDNISKNITGIAGISPLIKQSALAERVNSMVSQGIAFNVEQRATLAELSGKIATTFDAANGTLLRLVRIQQQDTTAGRLGMESALTAFLNNMYSTTEYMSQLATSVKSSLEEAMSLMTGENALSFEYQIQKWLGSLYSVGMSDKSVQGLSGVLGQIAAGQLEGITSGGQGNLVIMAANQAGLSVADLLSNGLTADTTNKLMNSMVDYLAKIYQEAGDSKVIQQQMASVYGMTASDLRAAVNLARSAGVVSRDGLTYSGAMSRLNQMANSMYSRTSVGEMMTNAWDNFKYTMASGIASNPALYAMYKAAGLLDAVAGGINIPTISYLGTGIDLEATVADLMRVGALGGSIISGIGTMIASGGNGGITGSGILRAAGVGSGISAVTRGNGQGLATAGGITVSESGSIIGNSSGSDAQNQALSSANDSAKSQLAQASEESTETKLKDVYSEVVNIYSLLKEVANGQYTISVDVKNPTLKVTADSWGL